MAKVLIELSPQEHRLLVAFLRVGIEAVKQNVPDVRNEGLDADEGERLMGELA